MDIKKLLTVSILVICLLGCITTVSAGLFDFLDSDRDEHDFGNFTMNVSKNASFDETVQSNGEDSVSNLADLFGGSLHIEYNDSKWADPKYKDYFHPCWSDDNLNITVQCIDCNEDNLTKDNTVESSYVVYEIIETDGDSTLYHSDEWGYYLMRIDNGDKSVVAVTSKDKD